MNRLNLVFLITVVTLICLSPFFIKLYFDVQHRSYSFLSRDIRTDIEVNETVNNGTAILADDAWFHSTFADIESNKASLISMNKRVEDFKKTHSMNKLSYVETSEYSQLCEQRDSMLVYINNKIGEYNSRVASYSHSKHLPPALPSHLEYLEN